MLTIFFFNAISKTFFFLHLHEVAHIECKHIQQLYILRCAWHVLLSSDLDEWGVSDMLSPLYKGKSNPGLFVTSSSPGPTFDLPGAMVQMGDPSPGCLRTTPVCCRSCLSSCLLIRNPK